MRHIVSRFIDAVKSYLVDCHFVILPFLPDAALPYATRMILDWFSVKILDSSPGTTCDGGVLSLLVSLGLEFFSFTWQRKAEPKLEARTVFLWGAMFRSTCSIASANCLTSLWPEPVSHLRCRLAYSKSWIE